MSDISGWTVVGSIIALISIGLLPYLWTKFWKARKHFIISPRFPVITLFCSISIFLSGIAAALILLILDFLNLNREEAYSNKHISYPILISIANMSAFVFCTCIVYRVLLITDLWNSTQFTLNNKSSIILSNDIQQATQYHIYKCCGSFFVFHNIKWITSIGSILIFLLFIVAICAPLASMAVTIPTFLFLLSWICIIIIGIIVLIKARKVKDAVLCTRETYIIIVILLLQIFSSPLESLIPLNVAFLIESALAFLSSYVVITHPLWMVYKNDGSLMPLALALKYNSSFTIDESASNPKTIKKLYKYLNVGIAEYNEFAEFLGKCFALENLLFFAKASVFRHVLLNKIKNKTKTQEEFTDKWCPSKLKNTIFSVSFDFLDGLYLSCTPNDDLLIDDIANGIFEQYISTSAINEINISYEMRKELIDFFTKTSNKEIEEYLKIFNDAILAVYDMLNSAYQFQFKASPKFSSNGLDL